MKDTQRNSRRYISFYPALSVRNDISTMQSFLMKILIIVTSDLIAEDGDDISHPNVFSIGNLQSPTLGDIRKVKHKRRKEGQ
jgi:hypothetical protein